MEKTDNQSKFLFDRFISKKVEETKTAELFKDQEIIAHFYLGIEYQNNGVFDKSKQAFEEMI